MCSLIFRLIPIVRFVRRQKQHEPVVEKKREDGTAISKKNEDLVTADTQNSDRGKRVEMRTQRRSHRA